MQEIDPWYLENLACPVDHSRLEYRDGGLVSEAGRRYPVVEGIPIMLSDEWGQTIGIAAKSLSYGRDGNSTGKPADPLYIKSLGISESEQRGVLELAQKAEGRIDPVVSYLVAATNGIAYKSLVGKLEEYPIPDLRLPAAASGETLLDIGCNWGRWSIAAARKGYDVVGLDPSLGAVLGARRVATRMGLHPHFVVGDARYMPFRDRQFDRVFSYSVIQHFSREDALTTFHQIGRILKQHGLSLIQMAHAIGIRSLQHQLRRGFRAPRGFEVRYWRLRPLMDAFEQAVGPAKSSVDCYFGLGLQKSDLDLMRPVMRAATHVSEFLRRVSGTLPVLVYFADSVYIEARAADCVPQAPGAPLRST